MKSAKLPALAAIAAAVLLAPVARAEDGRVRIDMTHTVSYSNLDLTQQKDRLNLLALVETTARQLCADRATARRDSCAAKLLEKSIGQAPDHEKQALTLARQERTTGLASSN